MEEAWKLQRASGEEAGAIAVAREWIKKCPHYVGGGYSAPWADDVSSLAALITREKNAAIEQERERCAKICDEFSDANAYSAAPEISARHDSGREIGRAIRSTATP